MQIKLPSGAILVCENQEIAQQHLKYGAVEVKPIIKKEVPVSPTKKTKKIED